MLFFILIYQNLQTLQDLENMRKEQIEEMDNTRSNLDELQNKLTEEVKTVFHEHVLLSR